MFLKMIRSPPNICLAMVDLLRGNLGDNFSSQAIAQSFVDRLGLRKEHVEL